MIVTSSPLPTTRSRPRIASTLAWRAAGCPLPEMGFNEFASWERHPVCELTISHYPVEKSSIMVRLAGRIGAQLRSGGRSGPGIRRIPS